MENRKGANAPFKILHTKEEVLGGISTTLLWMNALRHVNCRTPKIQNYFRK
jgi:hypothetical protein